MIDFPSWSGASPWSKIRFNMNNAHSKSQVKPRPCVAITVKYEWSRPVEKIARQRKKLVKHFWIKSYITKVCWNWNKGMVKWFIPVKQIPSIINTANKWYILSFTPAYCAMLFHCLISGFFFVYFCISSITYPCQHLCCLSSHCEHTLNWFCVQMWIICK